MKRNSDFLEDPQSPPGQKGLVMHSLTIVNTNRHYWTFLLQDKLKTHMMRNHGYSNDDIKNTFKVNTQGRQRSSIVVNRWGEKEVNWENMLNVLKMECERESLKFNWCNLGNGRGSLCTGERHSIIFVKMKYLQTNQFLNHWMKSDNFQGQSEVNRVKLKLVGRPRGQPSQPEELTEAFEHNGRKKEKTMKNFLRNFLRKLRGNF